MTEEVKIIKVQKKQTKKEVKDPKKVEEHLDKVLKKAEETKPKCHIGESKWVFVRMNGQIFRMHNIFYKK